MELRLPVMLSIRVHVTTESASFGTQFPSNGELMSSSLPQCQRLLAAESMLVQVELMSLNELIPSSLDAYTECGATEKVGCIQHTCQIYPALSSLLCP